jgi:DNA-binding SARP family transcriptional activator
MGKRMAGAAVRSGLELDLARGESGTLAPLPLLARVPAPLARAGLLLGMARMALADRVEPLERKQAALLAFAAVEGEASRPRLRGLLWPSADEQRASSSLRQALRRLRQLGGDALFSHDDPVILAPAFSVDAAELEACARAGEHARVLALRGELLGGLDYGDCPEFEQWLQWTRERHEAFRERATDAELDRLEREGRLEDAIALAREAATQAPVREVLYRRLMRLQLAQGDRAAAVRTFQRCRDRLRVELDVAPMPETERLAQFLAQGS